MFKITINGLGSMRRALDAVTAEMSPEKARRNVKTVGEFAIGQVRSRTPGKGTLRNAWDIAYHDRVLPGGGFRIGFDISNRIAGDGTSYKSAFSGKIKPKLHADGSRVLWSDVIGYLDEGTRPHVIRPLRYDVLIFFVKQPRRNPKTGRFQKVKALVFAKEVHHPGTTAYGMLTKTRQELEQIAEAAVRNQRRAVINAWATK